jgi:hypothetical protein
MTWKTQEFEPDFSDWEGLIEKQDPRSLLLQPGGVLLYFFFP